MTPRDIQRLAGVHPTLVLRLKVVFAQFEAEGQPLFVVQGLRTAEQQAADYAHGRGNVPGPVVTMCDGVVHPSPHQKRADGFGHAVDCAFVGADPFTLTHPWELYGQRLEHQNLVWGGRFHHPVDLDHAELPMDTGGTK